MRIFIRLRYLLIFVLLLATARASFGQSGQLWFEQGRPTTQAFQAVDILGAAHTEGLDPGDYGALALQVGIASAAKGQELAVPDAMALDRQLAAAMQQYLTDLHSGRVDPRQMHENFNVPRSEYFSAPEYLRAAIAENRLPQAVRQAAPRIDLYAGLRQVLAQYRSLEENAAWKTPLAAIPGKKLSVGDAYAGLGLLVQRLTILGDLPAGTVTPPVYEGAVVEGVRAFQQRHGLLNDGLVGAATFEALQVTPAQRVRQIELSLERLRWTPLLQGPRMIVVNIPEFVLRAYVVQDGKMDVQVTMKVIVGKALDTSTPLFDEDMRFIEFSPYWNIPASIARSETIPRLRRDPGYFQQEGLEFVSRQGGVIRTMSNENLNAAMRGELRIRQRPGPRNALGDIKFIFPNDQNIYLHHTPAPQLFDRYRRDFSHGCIRVEDPVSLAKFVLYDEPQWSEARIRSAMASGTSRTIRLQQPIPVLIAYSTVVPKDDKVYFFPDLYEHDALLDKALSRRVRVSAASSPIQQQL
ncbi:MAG TPA: L,D-transpeptidase family protein [Eoetvoesiella sp.]